jgi:ABC-type Zn2+ transport system substrate-binding protein/surface adhesin
MDIAEIRKLLVRWLEAGVLPDKEGERLLAALEQLIEVDQFEQLEGIVYQKDGVSYTLQAEDLEHAYWEIEMYYGEHEGHDHHHDEEDEHQHNENKRPWERGLWLSVLLIILLITMKLLLGHS